MSFRNSIIEVIGNTPIVRLKNIERSFRLKSQLYAKLEFMNPGGSVKDRIGYYMILDAERKGLIEKGGVIIEPTSGNTGMGIALVSCVKGYKMVFTMPDKMSKEKELMLKAMGGHIIRTPTAVSPRDPLSYYRVAEVVRNLIWKRKKLVSDDELRGIVEMVQELVRDEDRESLMKILSEKVEPTPYAYIPNQYENPMNPQAHYETTAREIWEQMGGDVDFLFIGIGTGGTITGVSRFFKEKSPKTKVVGIDPVGSIYHLVKRGVPVEEAKKMVKTYKVEGIGEDIIPKTVDLDLIDEIVVVDDQRSFSMARLLAKTEGILAGGSSGSALYGAVKYLKENNIINKKAVVVFPDTGRNYLTKFYDDNWMRENGFETDDFKVLGELM